MVTRGGSKRARRIRKGVSLEPEFNRRVKMSLEEKIKNAKETDWITDGIPKWQVSLIVFFTKLKVK